TVGPRSSRKPLRWHPLVHRLNEVLKFLFYDGSLDFHCSRQFFVILIQFLVKYGESLDGFHPGEVHVGLVYLRLNQLVYLWMRSEALIVGVRDSIDLSPMLHVLEFYLDQACQILATISYYNGLFDVRTEFEP